MSIIDIVSLGLFIAGAVLFAFSVPGGDPFKTAQAVFDKIEADAKARGCTQDIHAYRKARQAFTHAALRGRR